MEAAAAGTGTSTHGTALSLRLDEADREVEYTAQRGRCGAASRCSDTGRHIGRLRRRIPRSDKTRGVTAGSRHGGLAGTRRAADGLAVRSGICVELPASCPGSPAGMEHREEGAGGSYDPEDHDYRLGGGERSGPRRIAERVEQTIVGTACIEVVT